MKSFKKYMVKVTIHGKTTVRVYSAKDYYIACADARDYESELESYLFLGDGTFERLA